MYIRIYEGGDKCLYTFFSGWGKVREEGLGMAGKLKEVLKHRILILQL